MTTKLGLFCEKIIEAGIIVALVISPLLMNRYGENEYDLPKGTIVRSIAIIMVVAFIIRKLEGKVSDKNKVEPKVPNISISPLLIAGILMAMSYILSTILSVTPHTSWWGHPGSRYQGTYSILSYILIFVIGVLTLRNKEQIERIINSIILSSMAVCIYGLYQAFQFKPIWSFRVDATLGNPIFFGSYLIMVIPLTISRIISLQFKELTSSRVKRYIIVIFYAFAFLLQLFCLILTQSRGPMVGLMVSATFFITLWVIINRYLKLIMLVYGFAIAIFIFLIIFNIPGSPLEPLKQTPYLGRFGHVFETEGGPGKVRLLIWEGMIDMVKAEPERSIIGYGPEMMKVLYYKYAPPELVTFENRVAFPDRAHNDSFDILATNGFIGLIIYLISIILIAYYLLKHLGLIDKRTQTITFIVLTIFSILVGLFIPYLFTNSLIYSGVGITFGIIVAAILYIMIYLIFWWNDPEQVGIILPGPNSLLFTGIGSALLGHFAELQFGINVNSSAFYGWLFLALFLVISSVLRQPRNSPQPALGKVKPILSENNSQQITTHSPIFFYSLLTCLIFVVMIFNFVNFIHPSNDQILRSFDTLLNSFIYSLTSFSLKPPLIWLLLSSIILLILTGIFSMANTEGKWIKLALRYYIVTFIICFIFLISHAIFIYLPNLGIINSIINLYLWLIVLILLISFSIYPSNIQTKFFRWGNSLFYLILMTVCVWIIITTDLNLIRANNISNSARVFRQAKYWQESLKRYELAYNITSDPTYIYSDLAETYRLMSETEADASKKIQLLDKALENLKISIKHEPSSWYRNANLARLYRFRLQIIGEPAKRQSEITQVEHYYQIALSLCPNNPQLLNELGEFYTELKDYRGAIKTYEVSLHIDKSFAETLVHLGDAYLETKQTNLAIKYYSQATESYRHSNLFFIHPNQDILFERSHKQLITLAPKKYYLAYFGLARYYLAKGDSIQALELAQQSLKIAPEAEKYGIREFISKITK